MQFYVLFIYYLCEINPLKWVLEVFYCAVCDTCLCCLFPNICSTIVATLLSMTLWLWLQSRCCGLMVLFSLRGFILRMVLVWVSVLHTAHAGQHYIDSVLSLSNRLMGTACSAHSAIYGLYITAFAGFSLLDQLITVYELECCNKHSTC